MVFLPKLIENFPALMDDVDNEGLVVLHLSSVEPRTPVIKGQELRWSKDLRFQKYFNLYYLI